MTKTSPDPRQSPRYPATYAYDWIRQHGLAGRRASASAVVTKIANRTNTPRDTLLRTLAEQYLAHEQALTDLQEAKKACGAHWRRMAGVDDD